jgi:hypothetical protein
VSPQNLNERKSITVKERKATLSNTTINALTLAHKITEQFDNRNLDQKKVDEVLDSFDKDLTKEVREEETRDL